MNFQNLFAKKNSTKDKENMREYMNAIGNRGTDELVGTPIFESPTVDKLAKNPTGYMNSGSMHKMVKSDETRNAK